MIESGDVIRIPLVVRHRVTNPESTQISSPVLDGVTSPAEADLESSEAPTVTKNDTPPEESTTDLEQSTTTTEQMGTPSPTPSTTRVYPKRAQVHPKRYTNQNYK